MDEKERVALIRKGNQLFNEGKYTQAEKIFVATRYKDGLTRIGDYLYFEKKMPLYAYKYYKLAGRKDRIEEIFERMVFALHTLIKKDEPAGAKKGEHAQEDEAENPFRIKLEPKKVPAKLKLLAEEILRRNEEAKKKES